MVRERCDDGSEVGALHRFVDWTANRALRELSEVGELVRRAGVGGRKWALWRVRSRCYRAIGTG